MKKDRTKPTAIRIRKLRKSLGLSQSKFADAIGVTKITVAFWEGGYFNPIDFNLEIIAEVFGCTVEWLKGEDNEQG